VTWNGTSAVFTGSTGTDYDALGGVAVVFEAKTAIPEPATWRCWRSASPALATQGIARRRARLVSLPDRHHIRRRETAARRSFFGLCLHDAPRAKPVFRAGSISQLFSRLGGFDLFAAPSPSVRCLRQPTPAANRAPERLAEFQPI
jgi:hypothetical protein